MHRSSIALVVLCLHCGSQTTAAPSTEEPASPGASTPPAEETGAPAAEAPPAEAPTAKESAPAPGGGSPSKPVCEKLPKGTCQITTGCAWNDLKKCVSEGP